MILYIITYNKYFCKRGEEKVFLEKYEKSFIFLLTIKYGSDIMQKVKNYSHFIIILVRSVYYAYFNSAYQSRIKDRKDFA